MISFLVHFVRQHFLIICCCVITALVWPNLRMNFTKNESMLMASNPHENVAEMESINSNAQQSEFQHISESTKKQRVEKRTTSAAKSSARVLTPEELAQFDGIVEKQLYLSILGNVFDVSKGEKHYKAGESYNYFVGKDASVAFITGNFEPSEDPSYEDDDVLKHLKAQEIYSIQQWKGFYDKQYEFVGLLAGRFYDENGTKTAYTLEVERQVELAIAENERQEQLRNQYPPCNIEWKEATGTRVWCTTRSGGIDRDWTGVPRKFLEAGTTEFRCACVPEDRLEDARLKEYDDCEAEAIECYYRVD